MMPFIMKYVEQLKITKLDLNILHYKKYYISLI